MATRVFALLVGIDNYKSGRIWNLEACADDARRMRQWLLQELGVPPFNIALLVNEDATKHRIENTFMDHLINNPRISKGDAIIVYFAGHGSSMRAPRDWCEDKPRYVQLLCPYDHDTKTLHGRIAGISDRSLCAMLGDLANVKGNNITLILDCSFPCLLFVHERHRHSARCTPTEKAVKEDLFRGLWRGASDKYSGKHGFFQDDCRSHVLLAACRQNEIATEGKEGGRFTQKFLELGKSIPLHQVRYSHIPEHLLKAGTHPQQHPICLGQNKDRVLFNNVPFLPDPGFVRIEDHGCEVRLHMGAIHGVMEGTEFTVHSHNIHGSNNPSLDNFRVYEVHHTWSLARRKSFNRKCSGGGTWARITRWNNRTSVRVHVKRTLVSLFHAVCCWPAASADLNNIPTKNELNIIKVETPASADMSIGVRARELHVQNLRLPSAIHSPVLKSDRDSWRSGVTLSEAARYHMHLHRMNPASPFRDLLRIELFHQDPNTRKRVGGPILMDEKAHVSHEGCSYVIVLRNDTDTDLWPYVAYMDPNGFDIHLLYHPNPSAPAPTLPKHGSLEINCIQLGSDSSDLPQLGSGFLKLFVSTTYTSLGILEQGLTPVTVLPPNPSSHCRSQLAIGPQEWDTAFAILNLT